MLWRNDVIDAAESSMERELHRLASLQHVTFNAANADMIYSIAKRLTGLHTLCVTLVHHEPTRSEQPHTDKQSVLVEFVVCRSLDSLSFI